MSTHVALNASPAGARPEAETPSFFRHHGLMALGIRAFRSIGFPAKSMWVSAAFLLPILLLSVSLWQTASQTIAFSAKERLGVSYTQALLPLIAAAQDQRRAAAAGAADLPQAQEKVAQALQALATQQQALGAELKTDEAWRRVRGLQQALAAQPQRADTVATFAAHTEFVDALLALLNDAADNSNLTLDPDVHTFYLMDASVFRLPRMIEQLGRMRGMGGAILRTGQKTPGQHDELSIALAFAEAEKATASTSLARASAADAAITGEVQADTAFEKSKLFAGLARSQVLAATPSGEAAAYVAAGNEAIDASYAAIGRGLQALDRRLVARVDALRHALWLQLGLSLFGILVAVYLLVAFYRVTQGGIAEVARQLGEISRGNLTLRPRPWGRDEVAKLMDTLAETVEALRRTVSQVRAGAGEISTASKEVASASMDLSRRTEETAAHLQRTSAAMVQIGGTVERTADTATGASELVVRNAQVAEQGGSEMSEVVSTMGGIKSSSVRIGEIIGAIDGIAFQTNILALNAAVEAARAGEHGRGFAVVASEVRALAQRSASAAREIKTLINASVEQVDGGSRVVGQAGETMRQVVDSANRIKALISEISLGTREQTAGLQDVGQSVEQLDAMTQQNAALVEQTAAAAASLNDSAAKLNAEMGFFRI